MGRHLLGAASWLMLTAFGCSGDSGIALTDPDTLNTAQGIDVFQQVSRQRFDVLWVVDSSGSMEKALVTLQQVGAAHFDWVSDADVGYQLGVIRPDLVDPLGPILNGNPWIVTPQITAGRSAFLENLNVGTDALGNNEGMMAAITALSPPLSLEENRGFNRADADLEIIIVADTDDNSIDPETGTEMDPAKALKRLTELNEGSPVRVSVIAGPESNTCDEGEILALPAPRYAFLANLSGGVFISICEMAQKTPQLDTSQVQRQQVFRLNKAPIEDGPIAVTVDGANISKDLYTVTGHDLTFWEGEEPPYGSSLRVQYVYAITEDP